MLSDNEELLRITELPRIPETLSKITHQRSSPNSWSLTHFRSNLRTARGETGYGLGGRKLIILLFPQGQPLFSFARTEKHQLPKKQEKCH